MRQPGEQHPLNPELREDLTPLVKALRFAVFGMLIEHGQGQVRWPASNGSANYVAVSFPLIENYDQDTDFKEASRLIGSSWEVLRFQESTFPGMLDATSFIISPAEQGFKLDVLRSADIPEESSAELKNIVALRESRNRGRQFTLGITEPTPQDYNVLESAMADLTAITDVAFVGHQFAFAIAERASRKAASAE